MADERIIEWGVYPWFPERGAEYIHAEDLEAFEKEASNCKVFACVGEGEYITLRYNNKCYRTRKQLFKPVPAPKYTFGQRVSIRKNGQEVTVTDIMWHYDRKEHYYLVTVGNRKKSKRYFEEELAPCMTGGNGYGTIFTDGNRSGL
ncbi:MAG: hypothetical protein K2H45_02555 [Acetatifactor sp.]|nr:hypothetical protein [Acetatifactor sp.]